MRQCGFSVSAFSLDLGRMKIARELIDDGYNAETYRSTYGSYDFRIRPPSIDALDENPTLLPPKPVHKKAGRPKGKRKRKRSNVIGENNTSSRYNERTSAPAGGATARQEAGATAEQALSQPNLSQQTYEYVIGLGSRIHPASESSV